MKRIMLLIVCLAGFQVNASTGAKQEIENYYAPVQFDRMTECISDNVVYSVGMIIEKDGQQFVCNKFELNSNHNLNEKAPASWRIKTNAN
jgi:hypothetical protein